MEEATQDWSNEIFDAEKAKKAAAKGDTKAKAAEKKKADAEKKKADAEKKKADVAKKKASIAASEAKKSGSDKPYKKDTISWHVSQCVKPAGEKGITMKEALVVFKARIKKAKLECANPENSVKIILGHCVDVRSLATKEDDLYYPTKKLIDAE